MEKAKINYILSKRKTLAIRLISSAIFVIVIVILAIVIPFVLV